MSAESNNPRVALLSTLRRIVQDAYPLRPSHAWVAAGLSLLPPLLQLAVFGGLLHVLATFASGRTVSVVGVPLIHSSAVSLVVLAVLASAGLVVAAGAAYALERIAEQLSQRYVSFCTARVFSVLGARGFSALGNSSDQARRERFNRLLRVDAFNLGRQWHRILGLPLPILGASLLALCALWLEPLLCLAMLPLLLLGAWAQKRLMVQSAQLSATLEQTGPEVNRVQGIAFDALRKTGESSYAPAQLAFEKHLDVQRRTFLLQAKSHLITHLATAIALGLLVAVALVAPELSAPRLTQLALAVVMLRIAAGHLSHLAGSLTMIARFEPQTRRYFALIDGEAVSDGDNPSGDSGEES